MTSSTREANGDASLNGANGEMVTNKEPRYRNDIGALKVAAEHSYLL